MSQPSIYVKDNETKWAIQPKIHWAHKNLMICRDAIRCITFHNCTTIILYSQKLYFTWSYCGILVRYCNSLYPTLFECVFVYLTMMLPFFYLSYRRNQWEFLWVFLRFCVAKIWWDFNELPLCFSLNTFLTVHTKLYIISCSLPSLFIVLQYSIGFCHPPLNVS